MAALFSISPIVEASDGSLSWEIGVEVGDWGNYDSSFLFYESSASARAIGVAVAVICLFYFRLRRRRK